MLSEIGCDEVPRILVFNKADLIEPGEGKRLALGQDHAVVLSALRRETTRALLGRMAELLEDRWDESARVPELVLPEGGFDEDEGPVDSVDTLDEMLEASGRRVRRTDAA